GRRARPTYGGWGSAARERRRARRDPGGGRSAASCPASLLARLLRERLDLFILRDAWRPRELVRGLRELVDGGHDAELARDALERLPLEGLVAVCMGPRKQRERAVERRPRELGMARNAWPQHPVPARGRGQRAERRQSGEPECEPEDERRRHAE